MSRISGNFNIAKLGNFLSNAMWIWTIYFLLAYSSAFANGQQKQSQCNAIPSICPQNCIITLGGCSHCVTSCATILGAPLNNLQSQLGANIGGSSSITGGSSMTGSAGSQSASLSISGGSSFLSPSSINSLSGLLNYNPGNLGPLNPYLSSGYGSFATGTSYNPANPAQISSGSSSGTNTGMFGYQPNGYSSGQPSGPGSQILGNPANLLFVHTTVAPSTTTALKTTGARHTCPPVTCSDIKYLHFISGCPVCLVPTFPATTTTTTSKPTTQKVMTSPATCAPLRCVAPCDKGIGIGPTGCPMCLCK